MALAEETNEGSVGEFRQNLWAARRSLQERLAVFPLAYSIDGFTFAFEAPLTHQIPVGSYVRLVAGDIEYLGQVLTKDVAIREGPQISVEGDMGLTTDAPGTTISQTAFRVRVQFLEGTGVLLGRATNGRFVPPTPQNVFSDAAITAADGEAIEGYLSTRMAGRSVLNIGSVAQSNREVHALIDAAGFDRHTFLCGQSGSGKTYALGVILERLLLETDLRIVVIDPNSDYVSLGDLSSPKSAVAGAATISGPDEELRDRYRDLAAGITVLRPAPSNTRSADALRVRFSDLTRIEQGLVLRLDPLEAPEEFNAFWSLVDRLGKERYGLTDVKAAAASNLSSTSRQIGLRIENLGLADWDVWSRDDEPSLTDALDGDWRALVLDVGGFGSQSEQSVVAMAVLGHFWRRRERRRPVLIVIDEAHNVCPQHPVDALQSAATDHAVRIAGEGRKFGLYFLLATQRPQKLHGNVVSQCDNLVLMRMNSADDLAHLSATFSFVPSSLLALASRFGQGESLLAGKIVTSPLLAQFQGRLTTEGGGDVPTTWTRRD